MPWGWEFPVKADSVVSSIIPRVSNSPHRETLSLISPACLRVLTGHRERLQSTKWIPWESAELGKKKTILPKKCPLHKSLEPPTTPGTRCAASMGYCRCVCSGFQRFANLYERQQNCQSVLPDYCTSCRIWTQTASLSVAWAFHQRLLSLSEELLILIWPPLPLMTESTWYTRDSDMPTWNPKSFTKCNFTEANCLPLWAGSAMFPPANPQC